MVAGSPALLYYDKRLGEGEIDTLAIDPQGRDRVHAEVRCATGFYLKEKQTRTSDGRSHRNGVDYFEAEKFGHANVKAKISEIWGHQPYRKMLVVYSYDDGAALAAKKARIELVPINAILTDLIEIVKKTPGQRDDVMRIVEFFHLGQRNRITENQLVSAKRKTGW